uniref:Uncharacterized protein n=1 Tax=Spongospora subterranea TaxID=70186 RepID=A0A0H5R8I3_9EUKA|eukprot:CRZ10027.1 hypothetical protein [Spongospora subterranea]
MMTAESSRYDQQSFVSKLYWPSTCQRPEEAGLLIGWNDRNFVASVVAIVPDCSLEDTELALLSLSSNPDVKELWDYCSGSPIVIGSCFYGNDYSLSPILQERRRAANFWVTVDLSGPLPVLTSVYCCGFLYKTFGQILLYDPPLAKYTYFSDDPFTFTRDKAGEFGSANKNVTDLQFVLRQINSSLDVQTLLAKGLEEIPLTDRSTKCILRHRRRQSDPSVPGIPVQSSFKSSGIIFSCCFKLAQLSLLLCGILYHLSQFIINFQLPMLVGGGRIKDRSAVLQQLDRRIMELSRWPEMWVRTRAKTWKPKSYVNASMISFGSSVCQFLVDVITGIALGIFLRTYSTFILEIIHDGGRILHVDVLRRQVIWLMGLPAGMKLNFALDQALGLMVLYGIDFWNAITTVLTPLEHLIIVGVSIMAVFGTSIAVACAIDLLSMMTTHILFIHTAFSRLYSLALSALSALSKLFSGKKRNVLQRRVDSCHFDVDQLLLGTILFTLIFFLFPTVAIYYLFFAIVRFLIMLVEAGLCLLMATFNSFPFFELAVFFFDKGRLPSGIRVEVLPSSTPSCAYLLLHSCGASLHNVFERCLRVTQSVLTRYSLSESLISLLYGSLIPSRGKQLAHDDERICMDFTPGVTGFWFFLKCRLK